MKERPILFSGPMVRAILECRKTQTRRVFKFRETNQPPSRPEFFNPAHVTQPCPYGAPGDRLWLRETWQPFFEEDTGFCGVRYAAGGMPDEDERASKYLDGTDRWRPSIHMPRWASRITLEITAVRVERLQDITEEDVWEEGCAKPWGYFGCPGQAQAIFRSLWESVCGYGSWNTNPYVWVVEFRKVEDKR